MAKPVIRETNHQRRKKIDEGHREVSDILDKAFYNRSPGGSSYADNKMALSLRTEATLQDRRNAIWAFAKENEIEPKLVVSCAIDLIRGGWGMSKDSHHHAGALIHLVKMMGADHWTNADKEALEVVASRIKKNDYSYQHLDRRERAGLIQNLEKTAEAVDRKTQQKGGRPDERAKEKIGKISVLQRQLAELKEQMEQAKNDRNKAREEHERRLRQTEEELQRERTAHGRTRDQL